MKYRWGFIAAFAVAGSGAACSSSNGAVAADAADGGPGGGSDDAAAGAMADGGGDAGATYGVCAATTKKKLQKALDDLVAMNVAPGASASVASKSCTWQGHAGISGDVKKAKLDDHTLVHYQGQPIVSIELYLLGEQKKLSLDDKLSKWYPKFPNADMITVGDLANGTSGAAELFANPKFSAKFSFDQSAKYTDDELLGYAATLSPSPVGTFAFNNTEAILAKEVVQKVTGGTVYEAAKKDIFGPLGLDTIRPWTDPGGHLLVQAESDQPFNYDVTGGAGSFVGEPHDFDLLEKALYDGKVLSKANLELLKKTYPSSGPLGHMARSDLGPVREINANFIDDVFISLYVESVSATATLAVSSSSDAQSVQLAAAKLIGLLQ